MDDQQTLSVYLSHTKQQNPRNKLNNNPERTINTMCMLRNAGKLAKSSHHKVFWIWMDNYGHQGAHNHHKSKTDRLKR